MQGCPQTLYSANCTNYYSSRTNILLLVLKVLRLKRLLFFAHFVLSLPRAYPSTYANMCSIRFELYGLLSKTAKVIITKPKITRRVIMSFEKDKQKKWPNRECRTIDSAVVGANYKGGTINSQHKIIAYFLLNISLLFRPSMVDISAGTVALQHAGFSSAKYRYFGRTPLFVLYINQFKLLPYL